MPRPRGRADVHSWKNAFLAAGRAGLAGPQRRRLSRALELEELKAALGEAHVQLRVWKKGVSPSFGTSR